MFYTVYIIKKKSKCYPKPVLFKCHCSRDKTMVLRNIDVNELNAIIAEEGNIKMNCQFCHSEYRFDAMDIASIHAGFSPEDDGQTS